MHEKPRTTSTRRANARVFGILPMVFAPAKQGFIPSCEWPMNNFFISYIVVNFRVIPRFAGHYPNEQLFYFLLMLITPQGMTKRENFKKNATESEIRCIL